MEERDGKLRILSTTSRAPRSPKKLHCRKAGDDEAWAISFGDLLTLLLCFFTILLSVSKVDMAKMDMLKQEVGQQFGTQQVSGESLSALQTELQKVIEDAELGENVRVRRSEYGLEVDLNAAILYEPASADLSEAAVKVLDPLAAPLATLPIDIVVEGHTDSIPINNPQYASNWELSAARATGVVRHLIAAFGYAPESLRAVALADTDPIDQDGLPLLNPPPREKWTEEYLSRQRRVTLVLSPSSNLISSTAMVP